MPRLPLEEPSETISVKVFKKDVEYMKRVLGYGWSATVRELIHKWVKEHRNEQ